MIQRLADQIGLGEEPADDPPEPSQAPPGQDPETPQASSLNRGGRREGAERAETSASSAKTSAISAVESDGSAAARPPQLVCERPAAEPPPDPPPDPPSEPPPEPYVPPWEQLRPGQRMPGGSGW